MVIVLFNLNGSGIYQKTSIFPHTINQCQEINEASLFAGTLSYAVLWNKYDKAACIVV